MVGTVTMEEVFRLGKRVTDLIFHIPDDLRNTFAELKISSAAEILSIPKNHSFLVKFLESNEISCRLSRTQIFFPKIFVCVRRSKFDFMILS